MPDIEIRAPREEEFPAILRIGCIAFGEETTVEDAEAYRTSFPFDRALCAYEDGAMVATSAILPMELTLPGRTAVPAAGITWIATLPTHRRRGLLRLLMAGHFAQIAGGGEPLSVLLASESKIYGRFGYGPATSIMSFSVDRPYAAFSCPVVDRGRVVLLDDEEAAAQLPPIYDSLRLLQPGAVSRPAFWWPHYLHDPETEREGATKMYHVKHETVPGVADGYVSYRIKEAWSGAATPASEVQVVEVLAGDPDVYRALWDYVLNTDLSRITSCWRGRVDEPLRWLLDDPRRFEVKALADDLYLRLHDVPRALAARTYRAADELVFAVTDVSFPDPGETRYLLQTDPDAAPGAECNRATREPDLEMRIDYLAAVYLGGVSFTTLAAAGRVRELTGGAIERADAMFSTAVAPFCSTMF